MRKLMSLLLGIGWGLVSAGQTALAAGACCLGDGSCIDANLAGCDRNSGEFLGERAMCTATTICMGACCLADKSCGTSTRDECDAAAGTFQGARTTCALHCAAKLPSVFTYQGQLKQAGVPLSGTADLEFSLWTLANGGDLVGNLLAVVNVSVSGGLFSVPLDFGIEVFNGNARWLEIALRSPHDPGDTEAFTTLSPRQLITATPYALQTRGILVDSVGNIGIGTDSPVSALHVVSSGVSAAMMDNPSTSSFAIGAHGVISSTDSGGNSAGVRGENRGTSSFGFGVYGSHDGSGSGVYGTSVGGIAVYGRATGSSGENVGIYGKTDSPDGYAGYFQGGRNYFAGTVGIGTTAPAVKLQVEGGTDASPSGGGFIQAGPTNGPNVVIDENEIMARNNGGVSNLHINNNGGDVIFGGGAIFSGGAIFGGHIDIGYEIVSQTSDSCCVIAMCPPGKRVIGGGCEDRVVDSIWSSGPLSDGTGWECAVRGGFSKAWAVCANIR